ncbi:MAG: hypothetical protein M0P12_03315 [Paludibacteraceae bacterium]|nr:hypothetical protein [Paludibacteraceae bacterium]MCK9616185.1 hypothetical protein [Candidatus Omnitrophota bacterium]
MVLLQRLNDDKKSLEFGYFRGSYGNGYWDVVIKIPVVVISESEPNPNVQYVTTDTGNHLNNRCVGEIRNNVFYPIYDIIKD